MSAMSGPSRPASQASNARSLQYNSRPETPLHEDATLGITLLPSNGEAEHSMKVFMQEHITSILQPMAERVTELGKDMRKVVDDLFNTSTLAESNAENLNAHEQKMLFLSSGLNRLSDDLTQTRKDFSEAMDRQVALEGEFDTAKMNLNKHEGSIQALTDTSNELRKLLEDVDARTRQNSLLLSEAGIQNAGFADQLNQFRTFYDGLSERHMSMATQLQHLRVSDENTRSAMKRHISTFEKTRKDDQRSFMLLDGRLKAAEEKLLECAASVQKHNKSITILTTDMKHVAAEIGEVLGVQQGMSQKDEQQAENKEKEANEGRRNSISHAEKLTSRLNRLEEALTHANKAQVLEKESAHKRHKELEDASLKTGAEMKDMSLTLDGFQKHQRLLEERMLKSEARISQEDSNVDKCQKQADKLENDLRGLSVGLREMGVEVENQKRELFRTNGTLSTTREDLETTNGSVDDLRNLLGEMEVAMVKIGTRLELAHEYFNGMGKGLQDTHKRVSSGLDGMIPPKTMNSRKVLPEIPGSRPASEQPRTTQSSPAPRGEWE